jgi:hypothetical protein
MSYNNLFFDNDYCLNNNFNKNSSLNFLFKTFDIKNKNLKLLFLKLFFKQNFNYSSIIKLFFKQNFNYSSFYDVYNDINLSDYNNKRKISFRKRNFYLNVSKVSKNIYSSIFKNNYKCYDNILYDNNRLQIFNNFLNVYLFKFNLDTKKINIKLSLEDLINRFFKNFLLLVKSIKKSLNLIKLNFYFFLLKKILLLF